MSEGFGVKKRGSWSSQKAWVLGVSWMVGLRGGGTGNKTDVNNENTIQSANQHPANGER